MSLTKGDIERLRIGLLCGHIEATGVNDLCDLALSALTARSEGFREDAGQEWRVTENGNLICSEDFTFDAMLKLDGDFADEAQRIQYAEAIAGKLNALSPRETDATRCSISFEHPPHDYCDGNPGAKPLSASGWVPVSERLPTMQGDYLWVLETGRVRSETFFPKMASGITATHWMPLPPPPERP